MNVFGKPIRCHIGLHYGKVQPSDEIDKPTTTTCAFVCERCGKVIE